MKKLLSLEELAQFVVVMYLLFQLPQHISAYWLLPAFFLPDAFAIGFLINNRVGAIMYNLSHHKLIALLFVAIGFFYAANNYLQIGYIMYAHICFDRTIGYGLKYIDNPSKTHLGFIGKLKSQNPTDTF